MNKELLAWIKDILVNDEVSSDEELVDLFKRNGVPEKKAQEFVSHRNQFIGRLQA